MQGSKRGGRHARGKAGEQAGTRLAQRTATHRRRGISDDMIRIKMKAHLDTVTAGRVGDGGGDKITGKRRLRAACLCPVKDFFLIKCVHERYSGPLKKNRWNALPGMA